MKPITTHYKGYKFRSRLEARYAVFFDSLGIEWEYEPEGFVLDNGECYLPDFYLPKFTGGMWVEVKPTYFTPKEREKCNLLCRGSQHGVWLAMGAPAVRCYEVYYYMNFDSCLGDGIPNADQAEFENRMFAFSAYGAIGELVKLEHRSTLGDTIIKAVRAAKQARFEHGEKG